MFSSKIRKQNIKNKKECSKIFHRGKKNRNQYWIRLKTHKKTVVLSARNITRKLLVSIIYRSQIRKRSKPFREEETQIAKHTRQAEPPCRPTCISHKRPILITISCLSLAPAWRHEEPESHWVQTPGAPDGCPPPNSTSHPRGEGGWDTPSDSRTFWPYRVKYSLTRIPRRSYCSTKEKRVFSQPHSPWIIRM